jgi:VIT1/CCC1 family predicted Fe2+/Mn2+ transporter
VLVVLAGAAGGVVSVGLALVLLFVVGAVVAISVRAGRRDDDR